MLSNNKNIIEIYTNRFRIDNCVHLISYKFAVVIGIIVVVVVAL